MIEFGCHLRGKGIVTKRFCLTGQCHSIITILIRINICIRPTSSICNRFLIQLYFYTTIFRFINIKSRIRRISQQ